MQIQPLRYPFYSPDWRQKLAGQTGLASAILVHVAGLRDVFVHPLVFLVLPSDDHALLGPPLPSARLISHAQLLTNLWPFEVLLLLAEWLIRSDCVTQQASLGLFQQPHLFAQEGSCNVGWSVEWFLFLLPD